jgi:uncharacterized membrane protein
METQFVIGPNASLSPAQAWLFMAGIATVGLGIALAFALMGFWLILPLAGLELAALGAGLYVSVRRNRYREVVTVAGDAVRVAFGELGRGVQHAVDLPRAWTRVILAPGPTRLAPMELQLAYGAQRVVIGRDLTDEEREALAARLRAVIREAGLQLTSPAAAVAAS